MSKRSSESSSKVMDHPGLWSKVDLYLEEKLVPEDTVLGVQRFFEEIASDSRLQATAWQTVGAKGHDGMALLLVS